MRGLGFNKLKLNTVGILITNVGSHEMFFFLKLNFYKNKVFTKNVFKPNLIHLNNYNFIYKNNFYSAKNVLNFIYAMGFFFEKRYKVFFFKTFNYSFNINFLNYSFLGFSYFNSNFFYMFNISWLKNKNTKPLLLSYFHKIKIKLVFFFQPNNSLHVYNLLLKKHFLTAGLLPSNFNKKYTYDFKIFVPTINIFNVFYFYSFFLNYSLNHNKAITYNHYNNIFFLTAFY